VKLLSSYSYECKECTIKRIIKSRKQPPPIVEGYPDW
jgi:DNA-directed RNA polymerase subunit RPC12/RpoP